MTSIIESGTTRTAIAVMTADMLSIIMIVPIMAATPVNIVVIL